MTKSYDPSWKQVMSFVARAEREYALTRKQLYMCLEISSSCLSNWTSDNDQAKISLEKLRPFAQLTRMSQAELLVLLFTRLEEKNGEKLKLDMELLTDAISSLALQPEEQQILDVYHQYFGLLPFRVFNQSEYRERLAETMKGIARDALNEHLAEGTAE